MINGESSISIHFFPFIWSTPGFNFGNRSCDSCVSLVQACIYYSIGRDDDGSNSFRWGSADSSTISNRRYDQGDGRGWYFSGHLLDVSVLYASVAGLSCFRRAIEFPISG